LIVPRRPRLSGKDTEKPIRHLFLFIGADPATGWLHGCVSLDAEGFLQTGARVPQEVRSGDDRTQPLSLQSSISGVFAIGDARSGSVKRVGAAIGERAGVVANCIPISPAYRSPLPFTPIGDRAPAGNGQDLPRQP
jgi:thioredoxin reductase (NADPH)